MLLASHHEGEAWGLQVIPGEEMIITCGDDNKIMAYDYQKRQLIKEAIISNSEEAREEEKSKQSTAATLSYYKAHK